MSSLPHGWSILPLEKLVAPEAPIIYGILQPGPDTPGGIPYVRPTEIESNKIVISNLRRTTPEIAARYARASLATQDVLLSIVGTIGKVALVPPELAGGNITQSSARIRANDAVEPKWLAWFLRSPSARKQFAKAQLGTSVPRLNIAHVRALEVPLAPLNEQRRIVAKIDALFARSRAVKASLERIPLLLEQMRKSILAAAFTGRLTAQWRRNHVITETITDTIARAKSTVVRPKKIPESSGRTIEGLYAISVNRADMPSPPGWHWVRLLDIARLESGHTPSRSHPEYWDGNVPWIGIRDAREHHGQLIQNTQQHVTQAGLDNSAARLLPAGTVCLSRTASVGYVLVMGRPMATSQDFVNWVCSKALVPEFLMYLLMAEGEHIRTFGEGSTHTTIYFPEVVAFHVCIPPVDEQIEVVRQIKACFAKVERLELMLAGMRDKADSFDRAILAAAFRGELVPQDPNDEPASVLLERIRAEREASQPVKGKRSARTSAPAKTRTSKAAP